MCSARPEEFELRGVPEVRGAQSRSSGFPDSRVRTTRTCASPPAMYGYVGDTRSHDRVQGVFKEGTWRSLATGETAKWPSRLTSAFGRTRCGTYKSAAGMAVDIQQPLHSCNHPVCISIHITLLHSTCLSSTSPLLRSDVALLLLPLEPRLPVGE